VSITNTIIYDNIRLGYTRVSNKFIMNSYESLSDTFKSFKSF